MIICIHFLDTSIYYIYVYVLANTLRYYIYVYVLANTLRYYIYLYTTQLEPGVPLPSPELLKGKILLKDKIKLEKLKG